MGLLYFLIFFSNLLCFFSQDVSIPARTITPSQSLTDGQTLVSKDGTFELGFFSPTNSKNRYIGIWYKRIPIQTVVWVANRGSPLNDSSGILMIDLKGNLVLLNQNRTIIWSSNSSKTVQNPVVELLESGNLVLKDKKDGNFSEIYLWESFNCPSDTLLPGMKLGWNLKTGLNRYLSAWKNFDDPSNGDLTYEIDRNRYPEAVMRKKSIEYYRSGPWNGLRYSGAPELKPNPVFRFSFINDEDEVYYMYELNDNSVISRLVLNETSDGGALQRLTWVNQSRSWVLHVSVPRDLCDHYRLCGAFSTCDMNDAPVCQCLKGFEPNTTKDWNGMDWSKGCVHKTPLDCSKGEGFVNIKGLKLPDTKHTWVNSSMNLDDCRVECLKNCSCMGFTNSDIDGGGTGCVIWFGDLLDIRQFSNAGQDLYIRMAASDLEYSTGGLSHMKKRIIMIVTITAATMGMLFLSYFIWKKKRRHKDEVRSKLLDWQKRFDIVVGIARGLLYLHQDSRLRIIHRDLKASNILLDGVMDPKISDFGMARMFGGDQIEANTNRVVGTYGYMSPEYAVDGHFSVKSDVFSFGVLVLEIVSGRKNRGFYHPDHQLNLLGHAWTLWSEDKAMELVDEWMGDLCLRPEVLRCIQVGLLCVQQRIEDRPTMSTVLLMLSSESVVLPQPQQPGFFTERSSTKANPNSSDQESYTSNDITVTLLEGR